MFGGWPWELWLCIRVWEKEEEKERERSILYQVLNQTNQSLYLCSLYDAFVRLYSQQAAAALWINITAIPVEYQNNEEWEVLHTLRCRSNKSETNYSPSPFIFISASAFCTETTTQRPQHLQIHVEPWDQSLSRHVSENKCCTLWALLTNKAKQAVTNLHPISKIKPNYCYIKLIKTTFFPFPHSADTIRFFRRLQDAAILFPPTGKIHYIHMQKSTCTVSLSHFIGTTYLKLKSNATALHNMFMLPKC